MTDRPVGPRDGAVEGDGVRIPPDRRRAPGPTGDPHADCRARLGRDGRLATTTGTPVVAARGPVVADEEGSGHG